MSKTIHVVVKNIQNKEQVITDDSGMFRKVVRSQYYTVTADVQVNELGSDVLSTSLNFEFRSPTNDFSFEQAEREIANLFKNIKGTLTL